MSKLFTGKSFHGQKFHLTKVSWDNCVIGQKSLVQLSPRTIVPWTIVATPFEDVFAKHLKELSQKQNLKQRITIKKCRTQNKKQKTKSEREKGKTNEKNKKGKTK